MPRAADAGRVGFAPARLPSDMASLAIAIVLAVLFAAAITCAMRPAPLADPLLASLQNGL